MKIESLLEAVGKTPLVPIRHIGQEIKALHSGQVKIYAKLEYFNPGGSVKDRPAARMVQEGIRSGQLTKDKTILDATSGNTGIAYAWIGAALGYKVELVMPENVSLQRKEMILACGAKITYSSPMEGSDGAIRLVKKIAENKKDYFFPDQYNNPMNPQAHYDSTGVEIWEETKGQITHFVAGIGTSGTIMGTGRRLKTFNKKIQIIAVEPNDPLHGLEGLKHMASAIVPGIYKEKELDDKFQMATEPAYEICQRLAREEGLVVGHSSGAAMLAALKIAETLKEGLIVALFPDHGSRYLGHS
ncbi:MAG: cysteine synthase family protein [Deltaproteobacteria bacterium]|nr:cysteine synthase family protein [Deltaproteobacteria bacterium]